MNVLWTQIFQWTIKSAVYEKFDLWRLYAPKYKPTIDETI